MSFRFISLSILLLFSPFLFSCHVKRKEYIERNGLHSDQKPSEIAKELGELGKKQQKYYKKQVKRNYKSIQKSNRKKIKGKS